MDSWYGVEENSWSGVRVKSEESMKNRRSMQKVVSYNNMCPVSCFLPQLFVTTCVNSKCGGDSIDACS